MSEGEIRPPTLERNRYHLRSILQLDERGHHDLRKLTPAYAETLYDQRRGTVDTHRNGLSAAKAFGAWCVKARMATHEPVRWREGTRPAQAGEATAPD